MSPTLGCCHSDLPRLRRVLWCSTAAGPQSSTLEPKKGRQTGNRAHGNTNDANGHMGRTHEDASSCQDCFGCVRVIYNRSPTQLMKQAVVMAKLTAVTVGDDSSQLPHATYDVPGMGL
jgi:hypothetical protein